MRARHQTLRRDTREETLQQAPAAMPSGYSSIQKSQSRKPPQNFSRLHESGPLLSCPPFQHSPGCRTEFAVPHQRPDHRVKSCPPDRKGQNLLALLKRHIPDHPLPSQTQIVPADDEDEEVLLRTCVLPPRPARGFSPGPPSPPARQAVGNKGRGDQTGRGPEQQQWRVSHPQASQKE